MDCNYKEVNVSEIEIETPIEKCFWSTWKYFLRQLLLCTGVWNIYFMLGLASGAPTVFIPQIRREANSTDVISEELESWLCSVIGFGGVPWIFVFPVLTQLIGRKIPFIILNVNTIVAFLIFNFSTSPTHLLISEILQGMAQTCAHSILPVIITEYTSIKYRGIYLTIKSASFYWGIWAANAIGTFYHWKNIGTFAFICSVYTITVFVWPESPYWLATKGRFEETTVAYRWLKGFERDSEEELEYLIKSQKDYLKRKAERKGSVWRNCYESFVGTASSKEFYKPVLLCLLMMGLCHLSGKLAFSTYAIMIIQKITDSESTAYKGMLILDGVTVFGMYGGCLLSNYLNRRTQLLVCSSLGTMFLFITSLYLYLVKLELVAENSIFSILLLILFSVTISCGPIIMCTSIYGELIPLKFKSSAMFVMGLYSDILMGTVLKVSPFLFKSFGLHGACLFYGLSSLICILILYKKLPETKDKCLQEIESYFKDEVPRNPGEKNVLMSITT